MEVAAKLQEGAEPCGVDAVQLKKWLLRYGRESQILREELALCVKWLYNKSPAWAAYCGMMGCCLVAIDKVPGVRPLGIGIGLLLKSMGTH